MAFQMMFAIITPALMTGAFAERMKFSAFIVFSLLWATIVYDPLAHMVWGRRAPRLGAGSRARLRGRNGRPHQLRHLRAGLRGRDRQAARLRHRSDAAAQHAVRADGAALLWFGWFGFNAGSRARPNALATSAFVATNTADRIRRALAGWVREWVGKGKPTVLGAASGAVAGLVAITPASGFVAPMPRPADRRDRGRAVLRRVQS
jgi:Amt family ammonium transporter